MSGRREATRAELVRARRAQRVSQVMGQASQRPFKSAPHVTSRVGPTQLPAWTRRDRSSTRPSSLAFRLPKIGILRTAAGGARHGYWRFVSLFLVLALGPSIYLMWTLPYFHVPAVTLTGNGRLTREEIEAVLGINGRSIFLVQPDELAARLRLNYPEITSARVRVYLPNYVYVDLIERQPVILWQQGSGYTWIDAEGVAFRPRGLVEGLVPVAALVPPPVGGVPQDDTLSPPPFLHRDMVQAILQLAPAVPADSTLTYDAQEGLGWQDSRGWKVYFGSNSNNTALKLRVYQSLVESLTAQGRIPEYINVAFPDAPYYRMAGLAGIEPIFESGQ